MAIPKEKIYIYGKHAITEVLHSAPHVVQKVFVAQGALTADLRAHLIKHGIQTAPIKEQRGVAKDASHQGLIAVINPAKLVMPLDVLISKLDIKRKPCVVLLDEIQDPHNLGAIVRFTVAARCGAETGPETSLRFFIDTRLGCPAVADPAVEPDAAGLRLHWQPVAPWSSSPPS